MNQRILIKRLNEDAIVPSYQHEGDAGFDLHSVTDCIINPGETALIRTGLSVALPVGYELQVRPRSGLALKHSITVLNTPGTVDSGYRGEVGVILINHSKDWFKVSKGDRVAQGVIAKHEVAEFIEVVEQEQSARGQGGFGSTGV